MKTRIVTQIYCVLPTDERLSTGDPPCCCRHPQCTNEWDTLCIPLDGSYPYKVHYPDLRVGKIAEPELVSIN